MVEDGIALLETQDRQLLCERDLREKEREGERRIARQLASARDLKKLASQSMRVSRAARGRKGER